MAYGIELTEQQQQQIKNALQAINNVGNNAGFKNPDDKPRRQELVLNPTAHFDMNTIHDLTSVYWQVYLIQIWGDSIKIPTRKIETVPRRKADVEKLAKQLKRTPTTADLKAKFPAIEWDAELCRIIDEDLAWLSR